MSFSIFFHLSLSKNRALPNPLACHHLSHSKKAMLEPLQPPFPMPSVWRFSLANKNTKWRVQKMGSLLDHNPGKCYDMVDGILKQKYIKMYDCNRLKGKWRLGLQDKGDTVWHFCSSSPDWWGNVCLRPSNAWDTLPQKQWTSMDTHHVKLKHWCHMIYHVVYCTIILVLPCEHSIGYTVMYVVNPIINHPQFTRPYHVVVLHSITIPHKSFFFSMRGLP